MKNKLKKKLLVLEINQVPWRIIDHFKDNPLLPNIAKFFNSSESYTTVITDTNENTDPEKLVHGLNKDGDPIIIDSEELSPWVTWSTFHRGLSSKKHGIKFLGQDITTFKGKPIWQEFLDLGHSIGICGSLQSWPPIYPNENGFYIPDCFSHDESCFPQYLEPFQRFNLNQVQKNGLVIRPTKLLSTELLPMLISTPKLGITSETAIKIIQHLLNELKDKMYMTRRTTFQSIILWDIFKSLYSKNNPPAYASFFTNHLASVMHRYWNHIFPEDFRGLYKDLDSIHYETMMFALTALDTILKEAMDFCNANPEIIIAFVTSMGQDAITYTNFEGYSAELENVNKLFKNCFNVNEDDYKPLLAMVPQVAVEIPNNNIKQYIKDSLNNCLTNSGKRFFTCDDIGNTISIWIHTPSKKDIESDYFTLIQRDNHKTIFTWEKAGIIMHKLEAATAYHIPEGIMAIYGKDIKPNDVRTRIKLEDCKSFLLSLVGMSHSTTGNGK